MISSGAPICLQLGTDRSAMLHDQVIGNTHYHDREMPWWWGRSPPGASQISD